MAGRAIFLNVRSASASVSAAPISRAVEPPAANSSDVEPPDWLAQWPPEARLIAWWPNRVKERSGSGGRA